jgi:hypothetical protein
MRTFCTIITADYLPYAVTLYRSLIKFHPEEMLIVLVADSVNPITGGADCPGIRILTRQDIYAGKYADIIYSKYADTNPDALRWALKPVLITHLLQNGFSKVIYADCDLYFVNEYEFLFTELNNFSLLLTPGRTTRNPQLQEEEFLSGYKYGQFNAGFIGATPAAISAMDWWANCCAFRVETNFSDGLFVDQKYLDALPVLFEYTHIIRHKGCNIAFWNQHECKRVIINGEVRINGEFPIVFIHFTSKYIPELLEGNDPLIYSFYQEYEKSFNLSGHTLKEFIPGMPEYKEPSLPVRIKRKLLLRTRIKRWLFKLSQ